MEKVYLNCSHCYRPYSFVVTRALKRRAAAILATWKCRECRVKSRGPASRRIDVWGTNPEALDQEYL